MYIAGPGLRPHQLQMQKSFSRNRKNQLWFAALTSIFLSVLLLCVDFLTFLVEDHGRITLVGQVNSVFKAIADDRSAIESRPDRCAGRYIYVHDLPSRFNGNLLNNCHLLSRGTEQPGFDHQSNMCSDLVNFGFGPEIENGEGVLSNKRSWFATNPYLLEVIFDNKMKKYECLTNDSSLASLIYVPYYAGLDLSQYLWESNITIRDSTGKELLSWLVSKPEWKKMWGRDHFLVSGRTSWDFRRREDNESHWGSNFRFLPESNNMSMLSTEASCWNNDRAIPYPTHFHPSADSEVLQWQSKVRQHKRPYLFSFAGGARPKDERSIRSKLIEECRGSRSCRFFNCSSAKDICDDPVNVMKVFEESVFCLQPAGDSYTRRSTFDSMLAGCIPVFFHPGTAYTQYVWHLPKNRTKYSVYIPIEDVKEWSVNLEEVLKGISPENVVAMREEVIKLIPKLIYSDPRFKLLKSDDAFDLTLKGLLERVEKVRKDMMEGKDASFGFADENPYMFSFSEEQ